MSHTRTMFAVPVLLSATLASGLGAQQAAAGSCSVEQGKPTQVGRAYLAVSTAQNLQAAQKPADAAKQLQAAVKSLTEAPEKINNPKGRDLVLGKALGLWLMQPDATPLADRAQLGFANGPGTIDLVVAIDSLFKPLEQAEPGCTQETAPYRAGKPWVTMINQAIEQLNADRTDSATFYARRALTLYSAAPYPHMVLGNVAQRTNADDALAHYRTGLAAAGTDTMFAEAKRSMLQAIGNLAAEVVDSAQAPATKQKYGAVASEAFEQLIKEFPNSPQGIQARSGVARLRLAAGDTAGFRATYQDQLTNSAKYSYQDLLAPAVAAARANQYSDAARLFEATLVQNPFNRDALFNAALMYHEMGQFEKMPALIKRLTDVDPSNGENWRLYAHAYAGMAKALRPASAARTAAGRAGARPAPAARVSPAVEAQIRALNDSTVKYYELAEKMPVKVEFTEWTNGEEKSTVAGTVHNKGAAAKSFTMSFDFLDKAGTVVETKTATVESVAPNGRGRFSVTTEAKGVVAFRYKPLS